MSKVILNWEGNTADHQEYYIYRSTTTIDPASPGTPIATVPNTQYSYEDTTVTDFTTYYYRVAAKMFSDGSVAFDDEIVSHVGHCIYAADLKIVFKMQESSLSTYPESSMGYEYESGYDNWPYIDVDSQHRVVFAADSGSNTEIIRLTENGSFDKQVTITNMQTVTDLLLPNDDEVIVVGVSSGTMEAYIVDLVTDTVTKLTVPSASFSSFQPYTIKDLKMMADGRVLCVISEKKVEKAFINCALIVFDKSSGSWDVSWFEDPPVIDNNHDLLFGFYEVYGSGMFDRHHYTPLRDGSVAVVKANREPDPNIWRITKIDTNGTLTSVYVNGTGNFEGIVASDNSDGFYVTISDPDTNNYITHEYNPNFSVVGQISDKQMLAYPICCRTYDINDPSKGIAIFSQPEMFFRHEIEGANAGGEGTFYFSGDSTLGGNLYNEDGAYRNAVVDNGKSTYLGYDFNGT